MVMGGLLDMLRQFTGPTMASLDEQTWKAKFEELLLRSRERPRLLVDQVRAGLRHGCRGWAWCRILRISEVPGSCGRGH